MKKISLCLVLAASMAGNGVPALAAIVNFNFTGRLTVTNSLGAAISNYTAEGLIDPFGYQTPISASLSFDTVSGIGSSSLQLNLVDFFGQTATTHDIYFTQQTGNNLLDGSMLIDWGGVNNLMSNIQWDATGMINAINYGLQVGDKLSGNVLYRDANHDGIYDASEIVLQDLASAIPYTQQLHYPHPGSSWTGPNQGPAPMATTANTLGMIDGPFTGFKVYLDIGSGNSMYVTSIQTVPLPASAWLFGVGLIGLAGLSARLEQKGQTRLNFMADSI